MKMAKTKGEGTGSPCPNGIRMRHISASLTFLRLRHLHDDERECGWR
jgi:hypothetical protein